MTSITWNKTTRTYTVSNKVCVVRDIETKSQADAVKIDLRNNWPVSFGVETLK